MTAAVRHVAFLRGVSPLNVRMPELQRSFAHAGFGQVRTLLSSGNVAFDAPPAPAADLEAAAEAAMQAVLGRSFRTIVRTQGHLRQLLAGDPYAAHGVPAEAKRVVAFLRRPVAPKVPLPLVEGEAWLLCVAGGEAYAAYVPGAQGPVFMRLVERAFGTEVTTRTWDTVRKCAQA